MLGVYGNRQKEPGKCSLEKSLEKSLGKIPEKSPERSPEKSPERSPEKSPEISPEVCPEKSPENLRHPGSVGPRHGSWILTQKMLHLTTRPKRFSTGAGACLVASVLLSPPGEAPEGRARVFR